MFRRGKRGITSCGYPPLWGQGKAGSAGGQINQPKGGVCDTGGGGEGKGRGRATRKAAGKQACKTKNPRRGGIRQVPGRGDRGEGGSTMRRPRKMQFQRS